MEQSRLESLTEKIIDSFTGWLIALTVWAFVITPVWDIDVSLMSNVWITTTFTLVSIVRGYFWRRFFATGLHRQIHKIITTRN